MRLTVDENSSIINIALIGGGEYCRDVLKQTTDDFLYNQVNSKIVAVAEPDDLAPGAVLARRQGLKIVSDFKQLFDPQYNIHLFIMLDPDPDLLYSILRTKPEYLRVLAYQAFELFWKAAKVREGKLKRQTEALLTIFNGIEDMILVITPEQVIVDVNEAFLRHMGYNKSEVVGKKCFEVHHQTKQSCYGGQSGCPLDTVVRNRETAKTIRTRSDHHGQTRYMEVTIHPLWDKDDRISHFLEISHDITERKVREEENRRRLEQMVEERTRELQETHAKLLHNDKMASLGKLSASVVHEINNPIAGILNLILLMKRILKETQGAAEESDRDRFDRYLKLMEAETRRVSRIVSNLLTFSRQSKMKLGTQDINQLIDRTLTLNGNLLRIHNLKVKTSLDPVLPHVVGSADQLQQVFMNMVSNAAEAQEGMGGGELTVKTWRGQSGDTVYISFSDTGVGIPPKDQDRLFEPFYTTKKKGKGVGLGLSVVYGILKAHNGCISLDSLPYKGATFTIQLPLKQERQEADTVQTDRSRDRVWR